MSWRRPTWHLREQPPTRRIGLVLAVLAACSALATVLDSGRAAASVVSKVSFASPQAAGNTNATWTVGFKTSASGALASGSTVTIIFNSAFTVPASPVVTLATGFSGCTASASTDETTMTVSVSLAGASCTLAASTAATLTIAGVTNPSAGTYLGSTFSVATSADTAASPAAVYVSALSSVTFAGTPQSANSSPANWKVGLTTPSAGQLVAGNQITVTFASGFTIPAAPTIALSGFTHCSATATASSPTAVVTLANSGGTCSASENTAVSVTIDGITNPAAGLYAATGFSVSATGDSAANPAADIAVSIVTAASFTGTPQTAGALASWLIQFTTSPSGALAAGDTMTFGFDAGFTLPGSPQAILTSGFTSCSANAALTGSAIVVTLADSGGTCSVGSTQTVKVTLAGITDPVAGTYTDLTVSTSVDTATASAASVTIAAATSPSAVTFSGSPQSAGSSATWTVGFKTSATGALAAGDTITIAFGFAVTATASATPGTNFANCSASTALTNSTTLTVTLSNSGGTCAAAKNTSVTLSMAGITNPAAGLYPASGFSVATAEDTASANPAAAVPISIVTAVSFTGTPQTGGARASWVAAFTTSPSGALGAGATITLSFDNRFVLPASPTVALGGFTSCTGSGALTSSKTVTVTLNGASCSVAGSKAVTVTVSGITNPSAGSYSDLTVATSADPATAAPASAVIVGSATSVSAVSLIGSPQTAAAQSSWTIGLTPSTSGALATGDSITVTFDGAFSLPSSPAVTLSSGFAHCTATAVTSTPTITVTLAGASCALAASTPGTLTLSEITNPPAASYSDLTVATSQDTTPVNAGTVTIGAETSVSAVSFSGSPQTADALSTWTIGFTTSASGSLSTGDTVTVGFDPGFMVPSTPTVTLTGFSGCSEVASAVGATVTVTLSGASCAVAGSTPVSLSIAGVTNPSSGSYGDLFVQTMTDPATAGPGSVTIGSSTQTSAVTFTGSPQSAGSSASWTVGFTSSSSGGLAASDTVTVSFASGFTLPAAPTVTLVSGFALCKATAARTAATTVVVTLANNGGTCTLAPSTPASLKIAGVTNPSAAVYPATDFTVATAVDTAPTSPGSAIVVSTLTSVSAAGDPETAGALAAWTIGFTTSPSGSLASGNTITVVFDPGFSLPASPTVTLGATFALCKATATLASSTTITVTLANNGGTCALAASTAATLTVAGITNPTAGSYSDLTVATTKDAVAVSVGTVTISAATAPTGVTASGSPQTAGALATWRLGFTTSASGGLGAGDEVTVAFGSGFTVASVPTVTLGSGFSSCTASASGMNGTVVVTLAGVSCSVGDGSSATLTIGAVTNPSAGTYNDLTLVTTKDPSAASLGTVTIGAATSVTAVGFSGAPQSAGANADWTVGFTTSASGALAAGDTISIAFDHAFTLPGSPTVSLVSGFSDCSPTATLLNSTTLTVVLANSGGSCVLASSSAAALTIAGITNPPAGSYGDLALVTTKDTSAAAGSVVVSAATSPTPVTFSGSPQSAGSSASWTIGLTSSAGGALSAGDQIVVGFATGFTLPATPTITLLSGFSLCKATGTLSSSTTITATLANNGGTCALAASTAATLKISGITNPAAGLYAAADFTVSTSTDTAEASPSGAIVVSTLTAVSFSAVPQTAGALAVWTVGFTTSPSGALAAGSTISVTFDSDFSLPGTPSITLTGGFVKCKATGALANSTTITATLANNGGTCALAASTAATLTVGGITNAAAGSYGDLTVATSKDTAPSSPGSSVVIAGATSVSAVSLAGTPTSSGAVAAWSVGFTTSGSGALGAGDAVVVDFDPAFVLPASPAISLQGGFSSCTASAAAASSAVTITLAGASCALAASTAASLTVAGITNPAAGSYGDLTVATTKDTAPSAPARPATVSAATGVSAVTFAGAPESAGSSSTWTVGFTPSATGALDAGDTIAVTFPSGFTLPAAPVITLSSSFASCSATATLSGSTLATITLANSGGTCGLTASTAASLTVAGVTNPSAGLYGAAGFAVATSEDAVAVNPPNDFPISVLTFVTAGGTPASAGALSSWTFTFTTSPAGALGAGNSITIGFDAAFGLPATPSVVLASGFSSCSASASATGSTVTVTLSGASCSVAASSTASLTIGGITNPVAGSYGDLTVATTKDTGGAGPGTVTIGSPTAPSAVNFDGSSLSARANATWTVGFTTSASGALSAGDTITVVFATGFTIPASPAVALESGFVDCSATGSLSSSTTLAVTLADAGGTCTVGDGRAVTLSIGGITNPSAGSYEGLSVETTEDPTPAGPGTVVIGSAGTPSDVSFTGAPQGAGASASWTVSFTTSSSGALAAGNTITMSFDSAFVLPISPTVTLTSGFVDCASSAVLTNSTTVTVTLADSGGSCLVPALSAVSLTLAGVTNPAAGSYPADQFTVATSEDTLAASPGEPVAISVLAAVTFSGSNQVAGEVATWTVGFSTSAAGALVAGDAVTVQFDPGFGLPATPTVALAGGFTACTASATSAGAQVTITLAGGGCSLAASAAATVTIAGVTNPSAGSYNDLTVATSADSLPVAPSTSVLVSAEPPPTKLVITGSGSGAAASSATAGPITVELEDASGTVVPAITSITVNLESSSPGASFAASSGGTKVSALTIPPGDDAAVFYYGDTVAGTPTVTASASGLSSVSQAETITPGIADAVSIATSPRSVDATALFSVTVQVTDAFGNAVADDGVPVTLAATPSVADGEATLSGVTTIATNATGAATFATLSAPVAGTYSLVAEGSGLNVVTSSSATISVLAVVPAAPSAVVASALTGGTSVGLTWTAPSDGGEPITLYTVLPYDETANLYLPPVTVPGSVPAATVTGLAAGDSFHFLVTATNLAGTGPASPPSNSVEPVLVQPIVSVTGSSSTASGIASATLGGAGTAGSIVVSATGAGTFYVSQYSAPPFPNAPSDLTYYDLSLSPGSKFSSLSFAICGLLPGATVEWQDPLHQSFVAVSDQTSPSGLGSCAKVTVTATTTPDLTDLTGSIFATRLAEPAGVGPSTTEVRLAKPEAKVFGALVRYSATVTAAAQRLSVGSVAFAVAARTLCRARVHQGLAECASRRAPRAGSLVLRAHYRPPVGAMTTSAARTLVVRRDRVTIAVRRVLVGSGHPAWSIRVGAALPGRGVPAGKVKVSQGGMTIEVPLARGTASVLALGRRATVSYLGNVDFAPRTVAVPAAKH